MVWSYPQFLLLTKLKYGTIEMDNWVLLGNFSPSPDLVGIGVAKAW
jgi:hypothetical protein